jgi:hypothetical protein
MVVEETFLKKRGFPPLQVVGMEGLFGVILTAGVVMPVLYHININGKPYEDGLDNCCTQNLLKDTSFH